MTLKYLNSHTKLSYKHAQWNNYLQQFSFVIKHKTSHENKLADAFSHGPHPLAILSTNQLGFPSIKSCHSTNLDFQNTRDSLHNDHPIPIADYAFIDGY